MDKRIELSVAAWTELITKMDQEDRFVGKHAEIILGSMAGNTIHISSSDYNPTDDIENADPDDLKDAAKLLTPEPAVLHWDGEETYRIDRYPHDSVHPRLYLWRKRSDGQLFRVKHDLDGAGSLVSMNPQRWENYVEAMKKKVQGIMETFLDPKCNCSMPPKEEPCAIHTQEFWDAQQVER